MKKFDRVALGQTFGYQITNYNIPEAWTHSQGEGVTVAVLDIGCWVQHDDLQDRFAPYVWNVVDNSNNVNDPDGHGTHVCGTIAANNNSFGVSGIAPKCKLMPIKVLHDEGWGYDHHIARGIDLALANNADVINMSLGGPTESPEIHAAIKRAYALNVPVVCAAGNAGDVGQVEFPARYNEAIAVGAIDRNNVRAWFSNTGIGLDFVAPGVDIVSTIGGNVYQSYSGTSMATPWVSGVIALMLSKHRLHGGSTPVDTVEQIREHLKWTCIDLEGGGHDVTTGFGLIDANKLFMVNDQPEPSDLDEPDPIAILEEKIAELEKALAKQRAVIAPPNPMRKGYIEG